MNDGTNGQKRKPIESYRELFPVTRKKTWLNHASMGTLATPIVTALNDYIREHSEGDFTIESGVNLRARIRETTASFIGADPEEIAYTKNIPDALNIVAHGLTWTKGDKIVIADQEFPANVYPWLNLEKLGVEVFKVASRDGRVPFESVVDAIDERTRLVSLSWVEFSTGYRNDLRAISDACHAKGALFCVDAIQGLGVFPLDVRECDIDVLATSSHKWLLAPTGVGWMYIRRDLIDRLDVSYLGQGSVYCDSSLDYLNFSVPLWEDARRFEPGIHNRLGMVGLDASLKLFTEVGMDRVRDRIKYLTDIAVEGLIERGYRVISSRADGEWSGAVSFDSDKFTAAEVHANLTANNVIVSLRNPIVRLSPQYYNNEDDLNRFFTALL